MNIGVIVLNYKNYNDTILCTDNIINIGADCHIIIVDNASPNNSYEILSKKYNSVHNVDVISACQNGGYGAGNNFGARYAIDNYNVDTIAVINPDVIIPNKDFINSLYNKLWSCNDYGIIGGGVINMGKFDINRCCWNIPTAIKAVTSHYIKSSNKKSCAFKSSGNGIIETECVAGCFFMIKAELFSDIGMFDENVFLYNEENILGIKLKEKGYKAVVSLGDFYYHNHNFAQNEDKGFINKVLATKNTFDSRLYMCKKYYSKSVIPFLYVVEGVNRIYLAFCYVFKKLLRRY